MVHVNAMLALKCPLSNSLRHENAAPTLTVVTLGTWPWREELVISEAVTLATGGRPPGLAPRGRVSSSDS